ncbi:MAG: response regulator, partial [Bacteroidota bacterium]
TVHAEMFSVQDMIGSVVSTIQPLIQKNGNTLALDTDALPPTMRSDLTKVRQILFNLLSNASKFTSDGTVTLAATVDGDTLVFRVSDTGIGMTEAELAKLFQPFVQADASTTRKYGGTGLGLTISRRFAQMLGGDIEVASESGAGTTFTVRLARDLGGGETHTLTQRPARAVSESAPLVLVIDDDPDSRDLLAQTLQRSGLRTAEAAEGETGLALASKLMPDLITLDVLMPGVDGWAVLRALKANSETAHIPVVLATISDDRALGYALGAAGFLTKPFDRAALVQTVRRHVTASTPRAAPGDLLIVEDDDDMRALLRLGLEREGWTVREAATVGEALATLDEEAPALVLLDLVLPDGSGFDLLDALDEAVPVVTLTAKDLDEDERRRLNGQVAHLFEKGRADQADVLAEVERLLARDAAPA